GDFAETNTCGSSVAAGANCTISVTFTPTAAGSRTGTVKFTDNAGGSPQSVGLTGTGSNAPPAISLSATSLSFGSQATVNASAAQTVTLSNTGGPLSISSMAVTGTNAGDFSETNTCGSSVAGGANCTISVTFTPTAAGSRVGAVTITDNATGSPQSVSLSGTGTATPPTVSLSPASVSFLNQGVNTTSGAQTVTLSNTGGSSLTITSISMTGTKGGDFSETNTCGSGVAGGTNSRISMTFTPAAARSRAGAATIADNATGSPQSVSLTGAGTDFSIGAATGSSSSATVAAGQAASYTLNVNAQNGFTGNVAVSCTGAPAQATCTVPNQVA